MGVLPGELFLAVALDAAARHGIRASPVTAALASEVGQCLGVELVSRVLNDIALLSYSLPSSLR
jgi:hypothetical protein